MCPFIFPEKNHLKINSKGPQRVKVYNFPLNSYFFNLIHRVIDIFSPLNYSTPAPEITIVGIVNISWLIDTMGVIKYRGISSSTFS